MASAGSSQSNNAANSGSSSNSKSYTITANQESSDGSSLNVDRSERWQSTKKYISDLIQRSNKEHFDCLRNVVWCSKNNPFVRTLIDALTEIGCTPKLERHVLCANCNPKSKWNGWFDSRANQIVVCENKAGNTVDCCGILARELLHAYDACRARFDESNLRHVACTEIRAINFLHCPFVTARKEGYASVINVKERKKACVKDRALQTLLANGDVSEAEAKGAIDEVFERCYADLSPFWRHPRPGSFDGPRTFFESHRYDERLLEEDTKKKSSKKKQIRNQDD